VRLPTPNAPRGAVLYIHGFSEYFFQRHMAERFAAEGYAFYALDLRKYGRSLRPHQHPNFCKHVREYYADINAALEVIGGEVLLAGHSTGGLVASLYAHEGERRGQIEALWLNSPFFDWNLPEWRKMQLHVAAAIGLYYPFLNDAHSLKPDYTRALRTEWEFESALKPDYGFPIYYGWLGAVSGRTTVSLQRSAGRKRSDSADSPRLYHQDRARFPPRSGSFSSRAGSAALPVDHFPWKKSISPPGLTRKRACSPYMPCVT